MNVVLPPRVGLSLCAGGGGLDMGLGLAEPGFTTACFVEIKEYPRAVLTSAQAAGYFHTAPIWDDIKRFSGRPWRGIIDTVLAGYPCQPFSAAGQRKGADDPRHLWPDVARIIREVEPEWVFLENVPGHVSLGLESVLRELWEMGWTPATGLFSAGEVGAPHERLRVFIVARREDPDRRGKQPARGERSGRAGPAGSGPDLADTDGGHPGAKRQQRGGQQRLLAPGGGTGAGDLDDAINIQLPRGLDARGTGGAAARSPAGNTSQGKASHGERVWPEFGGTSGNLADASGARAASWGSEPQRGQQGVAVEPIHHRGQVPRFPPGPSDSAAWADTLAVAPDLAPATGLADCLAWAARLAQAVGEQGEGAAESHLRGMADGLASRSRQLRLLGNGVVPLAAGYAWRTLAAAHGLGPVDLEAASGDAAMDAGEPV
jgi:DNA (cytosine-5)-methyltransferase 1